MTNKIGDKADSTTKKLEFWNEQFTHAQLYELASDSNLKSLTLSKCSIGDAEIAIISTSKTITDLKITESTNITNKGLEILAANKMLKFLDLTCCEISDAGAEVIVKSSTITNLSLCSTMTNLSLFCNDITSNGVEVLANSNIIKILNLGFSNVGNAGAEKLAANNSIIDLDLHACQINDTGSILLATNVNITKLNFLANNITQIGAEALAANQNITHLNLNVNKIGNEGAAAFVNSQNLINLKLEFNNINLDVIFKLLAANQYLTIDHESLLWERSSTEGPELKTINAQHAQNYENLIASLKPVITEFAQLKQQPITNNKAPVNMKMPIKLLYMIHEVDEQFITHQLKVNPELAALRAADYTHDMLCADLERYANQQLFKLTGVSKWSPASIQDSVLFKNMPLEILCNITKYLSLRTQDGQLQPRIPDAEPDMQQVEYIDESAEQYSASSTAVECTGIVDL